MGMRLRQVLKHPEHTPKYAPANLYHQNGSVLKQFGPILYYYLHIKRRSFDTCILNENVLQYFVVEATQKRTRLILDTCHEHIQLNICIYIDFHLHQSEVYKTMHQLISGRKMTTRLNTINVNAYHLVIFKSKS